MSSAARTILPTAAPLPPAMPPLPVRRFTVDEYHRLIDAGILKSGDPFELIHGWIVPKMPTNPTHASAVRRLDRLLQRMVDDAGIVIGIQQPITTPDSEPEPDVTVSRGPEVRYFTTHPTAADVFFVIEVADSTLSYDQGDKLALYAAAKVSEYWIVNLADRRIEVYTQPRGGRRPTYRARQNYGPRDSVPIVLAGRTLGSLAVAEILPR